MKQMNAMSNLPRMHVSLYVSNLTDTVAFYDQFFGQQSEKTMPGYAKYILEKPALIISFVENAERVRSNFGHLGFQVESAERLESLLNVAREKQLVEKEEIGTNCCYANQDKFWVSDPDGHQWEVYYFNHDTTFNDPHFENASADACCMPPKAEKKRIKLSDLNTATCEPNSGCC